MLDNLLWTCGLILAALLFYRFVWPRLQKFEEANKRLIARNEADKSDPNAHFRHALEVADEQVEAVEEIRTAAGLQYLFEAQVFATRNEAEAARAERVGVIAQRFYMELPHALAGRETRAPLSARERAAQRWKRTIH